ncbi:MAG: UDP-N-acetylmuramoyl-L-alanyl-D-glutamate--2,6-diaminopimelate ligase [Clostridia bacterium]|nr:UDP-N-acetylmuramoyl-L-alanyl-D-glutamate--2,6-diaminopimelate ligase [Clostridia bacterium]
MYMKLSTILKDIKISGNYPDTDIQDLCYDSRKAGEGLLFVCLKGYESDGHKYAQSAYDKGCRVFCVEDDIVLPTDAVILKAENTRKFLALASANFFGHPSKELLTVAITGTKGKTSTSFMISSVLSASGRKVGLVGTIGTIIGDKIYKSDNSTPESYCIHKHFREMVSEGIDTVIMETSSQGFKLDRTYGILFDIGIFTNLSPDHIGDGEHADYEEYKSCKKQLFSACKTGFFNANDKETKYMEENASCSIKEFGTNTSCDYYAAEIGFIANEGKLLAEYDFCHNSKKTHFIIPHPGKASVYNSLCAASVCSFLGISDDVILKGLKDTVIKGRNEIINTKQGFSVIIDYAHNELSVKSVFDTLEPYRKGRIFTVFGCGGNRSKLRRYSMGDVITRHSDIAVITSDNPRFEKLDDIIEDIKTGITSPLGEVIIIKDRKEAIEYCLKKARKDDIVLIVGKGHQNYEEIEGVKYPFDEKQIVSDFVGI